MDDGASDQGAGCLTSAIVHRRRMNALEKRLSVTVKAAITGHKKPGFLEQDAI